MLLRFMPDTWLDAVLRPVGMAVPAGGIYVETIAPDFRCVFVLALALAWIAWRVRVRHPGAARTLALLAFCATSFIPWLASTGNGRYFLATLLLVGPLCVGLAHHLPAPKRIRIVIAAMMVAMQGVLLLQVQPWNSWVLAPWREAPGFGIEVPQDLRDQPATYVTLTGISYSLIAPQFNHRSRWINLSAQRGKPLDMQRSLALIAASPRKYVLFPSLPGQALGEPRPPADLAEALEVGLADFRLRLVPDHDCRLLLSHGLTSVGVRPGEGVPDKPQEQRAFWLCPLEARPAGEQRPLPAPPAEMEAAFAAVERLCPRFFAPGGKTSLLPIGGRRFYPDSDMRLYVTNEGHVMYKYIRALNGVILGTAREVAAPGFRMDCDHIRGRAGLPWDREI